MKSVIVGGKYFEDGVCRTLNDGDVIECEIAGHLVHAEVRICDGHVYLLQDTVDGSIPGDCDLRGYQFSWILDGNVKIKKVGSSMSSNRGRGKHPIHQICKRVMFNGPAVIVFWHDGTKTASVCHEKDGIMDPELGFLVAYYKHITNLSNTQAQKFLDAIWYAKPIAIIDGDELDLYRNKYKYLTDYFIRTCGLSKSDAIIVPVRVNKMHKRYLESLEKKAAEDKHRLMFVAEMSSMSKDMEYISRQWRLIKHDIEKADERSIEIYESTK